MKKFLIMLMVVAMASFLLVGCMPDGVTPPVDVDEDEDEGLPVSTTPVIRGIEGIESLYSSDIQYINKYEAKNGILVEGFAPKYSKVQVYIDGIVVGTSTAYGGGEEFKVFISKTSLGVDGEKTIYATATEIGLKESDPSTKYKFTLDTVVPKIVSVTAEAEGVGLGDDATLTVTCSEAIDEDSLDLDSLDIWDITWGGRPDLVDISYDLPSPEVIELSAEFGTAYTVEGVVLIRVAYEASEAPEDSEPDTDEGYVCITDLAGNKLAESVHYCFLELE